MADITSVFNIPVAVTALCWGLYKADLISFDSAVTWPILSFGFALVVIALGT